VHSRDLVGVFLKIGITGFGGPAAHIALMREEFVRRREWMDDAEFLEMVGIANLIPGPNSTELAMHIGSRRASARGLIIAGLCFILPAVMIVSFFAWLYEEYGTSPAVIDVRYGVLPVIIAIVLHAVTGLGRTTLMSLQSIVIAVSSFVLYLIGVHELLILLLAGSFALAWTKGTDYFPRRNHIWSVAVLAVLKNTVSPNTDATVWRVFFVFLQVGSVLYGSGYVLLAFLENQLVHQRGWITGQELLDAVAIGQVTPGPLFSTATFIGWQIAGVWGAVAATVGIFLPSFIFVSLLFVILPWVRRHKSIQTFIGGVTVASLGLMAGVLVDLSGDAIVDWFTFFIAAVALVLLLRTRWNPTWLITVGVAIGIAKHFV